MHGWLPAVLLNLSMGGGEYTPPAIDPDTRDGTGLATASRSGTGMATATRSGTGLATASRSLTGRAPN